MKHFLTAISLFLILSCANEKPQEPKPVFDTKDTIIKPPSNFKDVSLYFSVNTAIIAEGDSIQIDAPQTTGTFSGITFETTNPSALNQFYADNRLRLYIKRLLPNGIYSFSAKISNGIKDTLLPNVFNLTVNPSLIKELNYRTKNIVLDSKKNYTSEKPTFYGTKPVSFFVQSVPDMPAISINNQTGIISIQESVLPGSYSISLTTKNSKGFSNFNDILTVSIGGILNIPQNAALFSSDIAPIIVSACGKCHLSYRDYHTAFMQGNNIYDRVSRPLGDPKKMPQSTTLTDAEIALFKNWIDTGKNP